MMIPQTPLTLLQYMCDRAEGVTSEGVVRVVVLTLRAEGREMCVCMSRSDAYALSHQLQGAAGSLAPE